MNEYRSESIVWYEEVDLVEVVSRMSEARVHTVFLTSPGED